MNQVGTLEDEARKRKERLKNLKNRDGKNSDEPPNKRAAIDGGELPKPVFRSYRPTDENLKESQMPKAKPTEVTEQIQDQLEASKPEPLVEEVDLVNLAPRKPDWDLKRDVAKKLEKLERRTQRAIAELIRERLQAGKEEDLASAVEANMAASQSADVDDD